MNNLEIRNVNGKLVTDSRLVATMVEKEHAHLMRDIRVYESVISENPNLDSLDFFIPSTYKVEGDNKTYDCFLLTKKGCGMVAHRMIGREVILFVANYNICFEEMEQRLFPVPKDYSSALRLAADLAEKNKQLMLENKQQEQIIGELKPKEDYIDYILRNGAFVCTADIAKDYGMSLQQMNQSLIDVGIIGGQLKLTDKYSGKGYASYESYFAEGSVEELERLVWTRKGALLIHNALKEAGILPLMERLLYSNQLF